MIGLLTEAIGNPTPIQIPFRPERQLPQGSLPLPVEPGEWHFRQSIEYSQTANWAVLGLRRPKPGSPAVQHLADGDELDRAGDQGYVDRPSVRD